MGSLAHFHRRRSRHKGTIFLRDDSLQNSGILNGYLAEVDMIAEPENGDLIAAVVDSTLLVRYFWRTENGCIHLLPSNPKYLAKCVQPEDIFIVGCILDTYPAKASNQAV